MESTIEIKISGQGTINIGDIFYKVVPAESECFRSPCRVCGGENVLTVNGVTFKCPCCSSEETTLRISHYVVKKYKVCGIGERINTDYWDISNAYREIRVELFHKEKQAARGSFVSYSDSFVFPADKVLNGINPVPSVPLSEHWPWYNDYKMACNAADYRNKAEEDRLRQYNEEHGTAYEFPQFTEKNDKKG